MRTRTILIGALLLASAGLTQAQAQQQQTTAQAQTTATPAASFVPKYGRVDFGFRSENVDGDFARYNRFRDWRQGGYLDRFKFEKETETTFFSATANNVGYRDQRYSADFHSMPSRMTSRSAETWSVSRTHARSAIRNAAVARAATSSSPDARASHGDGVPRPAEACAGVEEAPLTSGASRRCTGAPGTRGGSRPRRARRCGSRSALRRRRGS